MTANIEDSVIKKLRTLPVEKQQQVLEYLEQLNHLEACESVPADSGARMSIWDRVSEISNDVPLEVWEELPKDGSINIDHYLFGSPKRQ